MWNSNIVATDGSSIHRKRDRAVSWNCETIRDRRVVRQSAPHGIHEVGESSDRRSIDVDFTVGSVIEELQATHVADGHHLIERLIAESVER